MLDYQTLDNLCDAINPLLLLMAIIGVCIHLLQKRFAAARSQGLFLVLALLCVYGLKFIDDQFRLWPAFGSDYSTHTAFALAVGTALWRQFRQPLLWLGVILVYMGLMLYQQYHTLLDLLSTAVVVGLGLAALQTVLSRR